MQHSEGRGYTWFIRVGNMYLTIIYGLFFKWVTVRGALTKSSHLSGLFPGSHSFRVHYVLDRQDLLTPSADHCPPDLLNQVANHRFVSRGYPSLRRRILNGIHSTPTAVWSLPYFASFPSSRKSACEYCFLKRNKKRRRYGQRWRIIDYTRFENPAILPWSICICTNSNEIIL